MTIKKPKSRTLWLVALSALGAACFMTGAQAAGDAAAGKQKIAMCAGCHGIPGWRTAFPEVYSVPHLGGQHPKYLVSALKAYKKGERPNTTMRSIAAQLSDKDMEDLAAFYASADGSKK